MNQTTILLVNLGTPDAPTREAVKPYLREFLSDRKVVEIHPLLWQPILNLFILTTRPEKSAQKYAKIWTSEGSPLMVHTVRQTKLLQQAMGAEVDVRFAMRYGNPSIERVLGEIGHAGKILLIPLYPQFAASSTATVIDAAKACLKKMSNPPQLSVVADFHDHPAYITALKNNIERFWQQHGKAQKLVMSFHGIPQKSVDRGDPYQQQCQETGKLLAAALGLGEGEYLITFQSRFGAAKWLQPYTQQTLELLGREGTNVDVVCPGFVSDCLETLEEINMEVRSAYLDAGGSKFRYIPALNESWIEALKQIAQENL